MKWHDLHAKMESWRTLNGRRNCYIWEEKLFEEKAIEKVNRGKGISNARRHPKIPNSEPIYNVPGSTHANYQTQGACHGHQDKRMVNANGEPLDSSNAAIALNRATKVLAKNGVPLAHWINLVHFGI